MGNGINIQEDEFKKLSLKNQNLDIYKVISNIKLDNNKLNLRQKLLTLSQAGVYFLLAWILYLRI